MTQKRHKKFLQPNLPGLFAPPPQPKSRRLATAHEQALDVARGRLLFATLVFALAYIGIAAGLGYRTLASDERRKRSSPIAQPSDGVAARADITDRNGTVLATSLPTVSLCADAKKIDDADAIAQAIDRRPARPRRAKS